MEIVQIQKNKNVIIHYKTIAYNICVSTCNPTQRKQIEVRPTYYVLQVLCFVLADYTD
jgi:hypothetical protein